MRSSRSAPPDPTPGKPVAPWLCDTPYAHRGLHGPGAVENSRSAFAAAIAAGVGPFGAARSANVGIELDVRLSRDGLAVVFHDAALERLTTASGPVAGKTLVELCRLELGGTDDRIESLVGVLAFVAGRAPLLIELKTDGDAHLAARLSLAVRHALEGCRGRAAVMSFDPAVSAWFARHAPRIPRGLVVGETRGPRAKLRRLLNLRAAKPHFLACDVRALPDWTIRRLRARGMLVLAWTVRVADGDPFVVRHADQIIYERA